jgi:plastocyanin
MEQDGFTIQSGGTMSASVRNAALALAALFLSFGLGLAFSEAGNDEFSAPDPWQENALVDVSIVNFDFLAPIVSINVGDMVRWTNNSTFNHTSTSGTPFDPIPGAIWDSGLITPGNSFTFTFNSAGQYDYFCTPHQLTMFGQVIVGGSGIMVAAVPDDISPAGLANMDVNIAVINFTPNSVSGDLWYTVVLPNNNELVIPPQFLTPSQNPVSGTLTGNSRADLMPTVHIPMNAPPGHYTIRAKIGNYPNGVIHSDEFEFDVP